MKEKQKWCLEAGTGLQGLCRWASCGSRLGPPVAMIVGLGVGLVSCRGTQPLFHGRGTTVVQKLRPEGRGSPCELEVLVRVGGLICFPHSGIHRTFIALFFTCVPVPLNLTLGGAACKHLTSRPLGCIGCAAALCPLTVWLTADGSSPGNRVLARLGHFRYDHRDWSSWRWTTVGVAEERLEPLSEAGVE